MYVIRPAEMADLPRLEQLARCDNQRVHTLPQCRQALARQLERSAASFAARVARPGAEHYTFVLERAGGEIAGVASLLAQAGTGHSFLAFRHGRIHHAAPGTDVSNEVETLMLCAGLSGHSQLAGFHAPGFLPREARALLSRSRLLYAALAPQRLADRFFAALPGPADRARRSAFWDAIGRNFFHMDLAEAEALLAGARNRPAITGLMPHYPVYVALLPDAARRAIAAVDPSARAAHEALSGEGFAPHAYVDVCDGGAVLQATRAALRSCSASLPRRVAGRAQPASGAGSRYLVSNGREHGFRAIAACTSVAGPDQAVSLTPVQQRLLDVVAGDEIACVPL